MSLLAQPWLPGPWLAWLPPAGDDRIAVVAVAAALGSALCWALGSLLFERNLSRSRGTLAPPSPAAANLFKNVLAGACFLAWFALSGASAPSIEAWPWLLLSGACGFALGDTLYFAALPRAGVQVAALVGLVHVPAAVSIEWAMGGPALSSATFLGMTVVLAGVALVVADAPRVRADVPASTRRAGIACAALGAIAQAVGVVVGHRGMDGTSLIGGTLVRLLGGVAGALVIATLAGVARRRVGAEWRTLASPFVHAALARPLFVAAMFGSVVGLPLFHVGLRELPSGVAAVLFATTPLFTLPISWFTGTRLSWRSVVGTLVGFGGVVFVTWTLSNA